MVLRENPYVTIENIKKENVENVIISNKEFNVRAGLYDRLFNTYALDEKMFEFKFSITKIKINTNGSVDIQIDSPNVSLCQRPLNSLTLEYCPENFDFELEQNFETNTLKFLSIDFYLCNNLTMNNTCKSQEEISTFLMGKYFGFSFVNHLFDTSDNQEPLKSIKNSEFSSLDMKNRKWTNVYIKRNYFMMILMLFLRILN